MKKTVTIITVLCLLVSMVLVAFAYDAFQGTDPAWATVVVNPDGSVTITPNTEAINASASASGFTYDYSYITIYDEDKNLTSECKMANWETGAPATQTAFPFSDAQFTGVGTSITIPKGTAAGSYNFVEGNTYYVYICAQDNELASYGNNWIWNYEPISFTYTVPAAQVHTEPNTITSLLVNNGTLSVNLLDTFTNAIPAYTYVYQDNGTLEVINTSLDKGVKFTTANGWMSASLNCYIDNNNPACDFVHKTNASTKYLVFSVTVDGKIEGIGIEPQFTGTPGGLRQAYLNNGSDAIYLVDANGTTAATTSYFNYRYQIDNIPENFSGYIVVPTSRFILKGQSDPNDSSTYAESDFGTGAWADFTNMYVLSAYITSSNNDSVIFDKMYYTDAAITATTPNTTPVVTPEITPVVTPEITPVVTPEATPEPTAPSLSAPPSLSVPFNDQISTPFGDMDITVIDDFASYTQNDNYTSQSGMNYAYDGEKLTMSGSAWMYGDGTPSVSNQISNIDDLYNAANYIGFYIKNSGNNPIGIVFENYDVWNTQLWKAEGAYLVSSTAVTPATYTDINSLQRGQSVTVPAGFEGYVFIPFTSHAPFNNSTPNPTNAMVKIADISFAGVASATDSYEIDNICLAASIPEDPNPSTSTTTPTTTETTTATTTETTTATTTETTTVTTTETTTTVPTSAPSSIPSDDPNRSGDISLVLYAVTALTAGGAIVAIKRKKA